MIHLGRPPLSVLCPIERICRKTPLTHCVLQRGIEDTPTPPVILRSRRRPVEFAATRIQRPADRAGLLQRRHRQRRPGQPPRRRLDLGWAGRSAAARRHAGLCLGRPARRTPGQHSQAPPDQSAHPPAQRRMRRFPHCLASLWPLAGNSAPGRQLPRPRGQRCGRLYATRTPASACRAGSASAISSPGSASSEPTCRNLSARRPAGDAGIRWLPPAASRAARRQPCCRSTCETRLSSRRGVAPDPCP